jgi:hypothetical protein
MALKLSALVHFGLRPELRRILPGSPQALAFQRQLVLSFARSPVQAGAL